MAKAPIVMSDLPLLIGRPHAAPNDTGNTRRRCFPPPLAKLPQAPKRRLPVHGRAELPQVQRQLHRSSPPVRILIPNTEHAARWRLVAPLDDFPAWAHTRAYLADWC